MERLVTVKEMSQRYGVTTKTARSYLRKCVPHMEDPLVAPEWAVREWEEKRMVIPQEISKTVRTEILNKQKTGRIIVPRTR